MAELSFASNKRVLQKFTDLSILIQKSVNLIGGWTSTNFQPNIVERKMQTTLLKLFHANTSLMNSFIELKKQNSKR